MNSTFHVNLGIYFVITALFFSCSKDTVQQKESAIFNQLMSSETGIDFSNNLIENDSLNYFTYTYLYMGGGLATGDVNNDGLIDIYFTGNQVSNKLYLNKGNLKFEDVTISAGVGGDNRWYTGVTMADVNGDGYLDIYCSVGGKFGPKNNQLFMNNGDGTFSEKANEYGLDDPGNSVQATYFDYDKDGDLDLYVANYPPTKFTSPTFVYVFSMNNVKDIDSDHLYRNDGNKFTKVSKESGILNFGLSLSATVGDLNNDSWPDIYVSNDFNSPDFMFINNQDGTFKEVVKEATGHTAFYGMGADVSDFNNDGFLDIFQVDMDANTNKRKKTNMATMAPELFWETVNAGFHYQYMHNCMQLNSGVVEDGVPSFSNVSRITGTSSTDWSWGPVFADFDNDGLKDLFVTNGIRKEINNNDYFNSLKGKNLTQDSLLNRSRLIPSEKIDNFMFRNKGEFNFEQVNEKWGITYEGFSNGVAYADLDNDGDLEIITNNIDDEATIFNNRSSEINNYIKFQFKGDSKNGFGLGNRIYIKTKDKLQMQELTLSRGFQSSVAPELHFGLKDITLIDEIKVVWTDGKVEVLHDVQANQMLVFEHKDAYDDTVEKINSSTLFETDTSGFFPVFKHEENLYDDFKDQVLLPHQMSTMGPAFVVGDLNNDGLEDYFIGGSHKNSAAVFLQTKTGFMMSDNPLFENDKDYEDMGAVIFDADQDGDNDLYVVSGGYELSPDSEFLQDRLYLNDGHAGFSKAPPNSIPSMITSGSKILTIDFDKDGKQDLLVLGRQVPKNYPSPANSYILKNNSSDGVAKFDIIKELPEEFTNLGMATDAVITDYNNDSWPDIIIVGEWMPIRVFKNEKGIFKESSQELGLDVDSTGWWWSISEGDFDQDGDMDYIVGNNGLNYKYKATTDETFDIYVNDFDKNNKNDIVLSYYNEGEQYPVRGRGCSSQQIPGIKEKFKDYESFSDATLVDIYSEKSLESALHYQVKSFASIYMENDNGKFIKHELPVEAQFSAINKILVDDFDKDGNLDLLIAGNLFMSEVETPRNDASHGLFLNGNGLGNFTVDPAYSSGFYTPGDVKDMQTIKFKDQNYIISVKNNDYIQVVKINFKK